MVIEGMFPKSYECIELAGFSYNFVLTYVYGFIPGIVYRLCWFMKPIHVVQLVEDHEGIILAKVD